jgi:hypothetical protein
VSRGSILTTGGPSLLFLSQKKTHKDPDSKIDLVSHTETCHFTPKVATDTSNLHIGKLTNWRPENTDNRYWYPKQSIGSTLDEEVFIPRKNCRPLVLPTIEAFGVILDI